MDVTEIGKKVEKELAEAVKRNKQVASLYQKALDGVMTYDEAGRFASMLGETIGRLLYNNMADAVSISADDIMALVPDSLRNEYSYVTRAVTAAQNTINKKTKVGLKAIVPAFDDERAVSIAQTVVDAGEIAAVSKTLPQMTENLSRHMVDKAISDNMEAQHNLGLETIVIREYDDRGLHDGKEDCEFCLSRAGTWTYQQSREHDVFRRHNGCGCTITYITKRSTQVQEDWTQNKWRDVGSRR